MQIAGISIHTFLAEGDTYITFLRLWCDAFQSTPSLRKATSSPCHSARSHGNFNPHLPCGRRPVNTFANTYPDNFNPHLPCGRRQASLANHTALVEFQSTPSLRKATVRGDFPAVPTETFQSTPSLRKATMTFEQLTKQFLISIHTFLAEGDPARS